MNKSELIDFVAEQTGETKATTQRVLDGIVDGLKTALAKGQRVSLTNVFTLESRFSPAKKGRNPQDGSEIQIPARYQVKFRPGKSLKEAANKQK